MTPSDFLRAYEAALEAKDLDTALGMIADDAVYLFSNQTSHIGKDAIRKALKANFDTIKGDTYRTYDVIWLVNTNEAAVCVYAFDWAGEIDGKPASGSGRGTTVLQRIDGNWRIVHEHLSKGRL